MGERRARRDQPMMPDYGQRRWSEPLRDECSLLVAAPGLRDPAAGRRELVGRGRSGAFVSRSGLGRPENDFASLNTTCMTWDLMHLARMIVDAGGISAHGNQRSKWDAGCCFDYPNPGYR